MRFLLSSLLAMSCVLPTVAFAQDPEVPDPRDAWDLTAVIRGPTDVAVGRTIVLDASASQVPGEQAEYLWYVEDRADPISRDVEAIYTPEKPGTVIFRLILRSLIEGERREVRAQHVVTAYNRKIILIADETASETLLIAQRDAAIEQGVSLQILRPGQGNVPLSTEVALTQTIIEQRQMFDGAETIVVWTQGIRGVQALTNAAQQQEELAANVRAQSLVVITERSLSTIARSARGLLTALEPRRIILTRSAGIATILEASQEEVILGTLQERGIEAVPLGKSELLQTPWSILSPLVTYMLRNGVPSETILLLLLLPIIATILTFLKQVVGITTFGLFTPSIIVLSFLALGWPAGVAFLLIIIATGYATRVFMQRWRMLYIPKVAIVLTVVTLTLLILLALGASIGLRFPRETIFILLIMSTLSESFMNLKTEEGWGSALIGVVETILAALLCVFIVQTPLVQSYILAYPEIILITIIINIVLGRWTGLRLVEYFRFREVFKHLQEE